MENKEYIPRYAAGSREDNIRTGRKIVLDSNGSPKRRKNSALPVLILILILLLSVYFFGPISGSVTSTITSTNRSADNSTMYITATIINSTDRFVFYVAGTASIQDSKGIVIGIKSANISSILKPGDTKNITLEIPITPSNDTLACSLNLSAHRIPIK